MASGLQLFVCFAGVLRCTDGAAWPRICRRRKKKDRDRPMARRRASWTVDPLHPRKKGGIQAGIFVGAVRSRGMDRDLECGGVECPPFPPHGRDVPGRTTPRVGSAPKIHRSSRIIDHIATSSAGRVVFRDPRERRGFPHLNVVIEALSIETFRFKMTGYTTSTLRDLDGRSREGGTNPVRFVFQVSVRNQQQHDHNTRANASLAAAQASPSTHLSHERYVKITWDKKDPSQSRSVRRRTCKRAARTKVRTTGPVTTNTSTTRQATNPFERRLENELRRNRRNHRNETEEFKHTIGRAKLPQSDRTLRPKVHIPKLQSGHE